MIKVSICVVAYNAEFTIEKTLNSILPIVEREKAEIIIVDDGSTDQTLDIATSKLSNVAGDYKRLLTQVNLGTAVGRNRAISEANGDWIFFVDADDCVLANNVLACIDMLAEVNSRIVRTKWMNMNEDSKYEKFFSKQAVTTTHSIKLRDINAKRDFVNERGYWRYFYDRAFLQDILQPFTPTFTDVGGRYILDDYYFLVRIANAIDEFSEMDVVCYLYRDRSSGRSQDYLKQIDKEALALSTFLTLVKSTNEFSRFVADELYSRFRKVSQILIAELRVDHAQFKVWDLICLLSRSRVDFLRRMSYIIHYFCKSLCSKFIEKNKIRLD